MDEEITRTSSDCFLVSPTHDEASLSCALLLVESNSIRGGGGKALLNGGGPVLLIIFCRDLSCCESLVCC